MERDRVFQYGLCFLLCLTLVLSVFPLRSQATAADFAEKASQQLREGMVQRKPMVTVTYESDTDIFSADNFQEDGRKLIKDIFNRAIAHTGNSVEGDYLRWHTRSCKEALKLDYECDETGKETYIYTLTFELSYYTTAEQEAAVTAQIQAALAQLNLDGKTDYEKIKAIYDYICAHVKYDDAHLNDPNYELKYSAYAALINGTAVCQGYSSLFYRMAMEAGLDNRVILGTSRGQNHAWNIVKLDGVYYNLDSTWDAITKDYSYFLKTDTNMSDHTREATYKTPEFLAVYPMTSADYPLSKAPEPTAPPTQAPTVAPTTMPTTQPATQPTTQPITVPTMPVTLLPTTVPTQMPSTVPSTTESKSATEPSSPGTPTKGNEKETWILLSGGMVLLGGAVCAAVILVRKRKIK